MQAAAPRLDFPVKPIERLSVTSYPFRAYINSPNNRDRKPDLPGMDILQFPAMIAEKFGIHNINPLSSHFASAEPAYFDRFRAALAKSQSHIVDLGLPGRNFCSADASVRKASVDFGRKWIDVAQNIGSPSVRQHLNAGKTGAPGVDVTAQSLAELADHGAKRGVVINLENDDPLSEDPFFIVHVIEKVNNPYLRALPDFGNSLPGHDAAYNERAVAELFKHAFNMAHVKDIAWSGKGEAHPVDIKKMFSIASASAYRGYFSMEFETEAGDPFAGTKKLIDQTLQFLT